MRAISLLQFGGAGLLLQGIGIDSVLNTGNHCLHETRRMTQAVLTAGLYRLWAHPADRCFELCSRRRRVVDSRNHVSA